MNRMWTWIITIGMILIAIGVLMPIMGYRMDMCRWIYGAGAVMSLVGRLMTPYRGANMRVKRLHRIEVWSSVFFCAATFFMFYQSNGARDWLAFTLAGGAVLVYTSIMIPRAEKKGSN